MMNLIKKASEFWTEPHFAFVTFVTETHYVPGDERSKSCPGHGYPEHYDESNTMNYYAFDTRDEWQRYIQTYCLQNPGKKDFVAFEVGKVAKATLKVEVS